MFGLKFVLYNFKGFENLCNCLDFHIIQHKNANYWDFTSFRKSSWFFLPEISQFNEQLFLLLVRQHRNYTLDRTITHDKIL